MNNSYSNSIYPSKPCTSYNVVACLAALGMFFLILPSLASSKREESAARIIAQSTTYTANADKLIAQMDKDTNAATSLSGEAHRYQSNVIPRMKPLTGAKLAAARKIYQSDLRQFSEHAKTYREHTQNVRTQLGQCEASRRAYEANKMAYTLHCKDFHVEDIPPPHICLSMMQAMGDSKVASNKMRDSMKRMMEAQIDLMKNEQRLTDAIKASPQVDADVRKQNEINLREQSLAQEFAELQEEYRQLAVEHRALGGSGHKVAIPSVKGHLNH